MPREISEDVLLEVSKEEYSEGKPVVVRVVSWNNAAPKLEKRSFWTNEDGQLRAGKNLGFSLDDFQIVLEKQDDILKALNWKSNLTQQ